jgi:hypothetical protein
MSLLGPHELGAARVTAREFRQFITLRPIGRLRQRSSLSQRQILLN